MTVIVAAVIVAAAVVLVASQRRTPRERLLERHVDRLELELRLASRERHAAFVAALRAAGAGPEAAARTVEALAPAEPPADEEEESDVDRDDDLFDLVYDGGFDDFPGGPLGLVSEESAAV